MKDDDFVDPVEELGTEKLLQDGVHTIFHGLMSLGSKTNPM